jgi:hypothetical protein
LNFFAFYFGGIFRVDFSRFTLYFGGIWLYIPLGTTFEQKNYTVLPWERLFVASAICELRESVKKIYFIIIEAKLLQGIKTRFALLVPY